MKDFNKTNKEITAKTLGIKTGDIFLYKWAKGKKSENKIQYVALVDEKTRIITMLKYERDKKGIQSRQGYSFEAWHDLKYNKKVKRGNREDSALVYIPWRQPIFNCDNQFVRDYYESKKYD